MQVPTWAGQLIDLKKAAASQDYCDEIKGVARENGVEVTELSTHLQGQLVAVHPAYDELFDGFAAPEVRGNPEGPAGLGRRPGEHGAAGLATAWASARWRPSPARSPGPSSIPGRSGPPG